MASSDVYDDFALAGLDISKWTITGAVTRSTYSDSSSPTIYNVMMVGGAATGQANSKSTLKYVTGTSLTVGANDLSEYIFTPMSGIDFPITGTDTAEFSLKVEGSNARLRALYTATGDTITFQALNSASTIAAIGSGSSAAITLTSTTYPNYQWIRVRYSVRSKMWYWESSPDGYVWTVRHTVTDAQATTNNITTGSLLRMQIIKTGTGSALSVGKVNTRSDLNRGYNWLTDDFNAYPTATMTSSDVPTTQFGQWVQASATASAIVADPTTTLSSKKLLSLPAGANVAGAPITSETLRDVSISFRTYSSATTVNTNVSWRVSDISGAANPSEFMLQIIPAADAVTIFSQYNRDNWLYTNSNFEVNTTGWQAGRAAPTTVFARSSTAGFPFNGTWSLRVTTTATGNSAVSWLTGTSGLGSVSWMSVSEGSPYTFSAYTKAGTVARDVRVGMEWYDEGGSYLSTTYSTTTTNATGSHQRRTVTGDAPVGAKYVSPVMETLNGTAGEFHYFDAVQMEQASTASVYSETLLNTSTAGSASVSLSTEAGRWYDYKVIHDRAALVVYRDGEEILRGDFPDYPNSGYVTFSASGTGTAYVDDVVIKRGAFTQEGALFSMDAPQNMPAGYTYATDVHQFEYIRLVDENTDETMYLMPSLGAVWLKDIDLGSAAARSIIVPRTLSDGSNSYTRFHAEKSVALSAYILTDWYGTVAQHSDAFSAWAIPGRAIKMVFRPQSYDGNADVREIALVGSQFQAPMETTNRQHTVATLQWVAPDGGSYSTTDRSQIISGTASTWVTGYVTSKGSDRTEPVIRFHGPCVYPVLINESIETASGEPARLGLNVTLEAGEFVELNYKTRRVAYMGQTDEAANRLNWLGVGQWFALKPGRNVMRFYGGDASSKVEVAWNDKYIV